MDNYVGKRLDGRYEIHEVIGVGGMAVVYKAFDKIDRKIVAVKILKDEYLTDEDFKRRFKNESKAIAVLSHPNIVKVLDVSFGDRLQYIVMEYVEGITLKEYIQQQGKVKIREALYFIMQILRALQHAHDKGIVHRDIKPQNIILISNGTIKVTDFGIATFSRDETKNMSDSAIGSVHYIIPEQAKGSITDAKSDIYSVGVVLYEMLTGSLPFQSDNAVSVAVMQVQKRPKQPSEINPDIPVGLEQIIMRAMQKNPSERYQSAAEMLVDIGEFGKNPNIKFDYEFFVDNQPTKYIPSKEVNKQLGQDEDAGIDDMSEEDKKRRRTIGVLSGVLGGLLIFIIVMIIVFASGSSKKITVPDFRGKNYAADIVANEEYADLIPYFETKLVIDSNAADGEIINQSPEGGKKISKGDKIILEIASNNSKVEVPDVYGYDIATAQTVLRSEGFLVEVDYEANNDVEEGRVIRTSPEKGAQAVSGSTIVIYIPGSGVIEDLVRVPMLTGETLDSAKKILEERGLVLDVNSSTYRDSDRPKGQIIGNDRAGQEVPKGTKISVIISSGVQGHAEITIKLPKVEDGEGKLEINLNGETQEKQKVVLDGSEFTFSIGGSGTSDVIEVYIDGQKVYSARADFIYGQLNDEIITSEKTYKYTTETTTESTTEEPKTEKTTESTTKKKTEPESSSATNTTESTSERQTVDHNSTEPTKDVDATTKGDDPTESDNTTGSEEPDESEGADGTDEADAESDESGDPDETDE